MQECIVEVGGDNRGKGYIEGRRVNWRQEVYIEVWKVYCMQEEILEVGGDIGGRMIYVLGDNGGSSGYQKQQVIMEDKYLRFQNRGQWDKVDMNVTR